MVLKAQANGIAGSFPCAAELEQKPCGVETLRRKGTAIVADRNFIGISVHDRLDCVLEMVSTEIHILTNDDGVHREDGSVRSSSSW